MKKTIDNEVLEVLKTIEVNGKTVTMPQLERRLYTKVNDVLMLLGGKWNRSSKAHVFTENPSEVIADAITTGEVFDAKKAFQFFPTPPELADKIVSLANISSRHSVMEPSCGEGAIIAAIVKAHPDLKYPVIAFDIQKEMADKVLKRFGNRVAMAVHDFTKLTRDEVLVDRIVANPPFTRGQDIVHVRKMYELLDVGGRMVSIMSSGWTYRTDKAATAFREWIESIDCNVEEIPSGAFKKSGTMVATQLLTINKE